MKEKGILLLSLLLAGVLVNSTGFVFAQTNATSTNQTSTTATPEDISNLGQYVSAFVHEHIASFKQQRAETIDAIKNCREDLKNADNNEDRTDAQESCKATLKEVREKYKAQREEYRQLFKEYRDSMKILIKEVAKSQWQVRLDQHAVTFRSEAEALAFTRTLEARLYAPHQIPGRQQQRAAG